MTLQEDYTELKEEVENTSLAMELLKYSKLQNEHLEKNNKRLYILLIVVVLLWFSTIIGGYFYITHFGVETDIQTADTSEGGNACVGDNCYNGDIEYGEGN